MTYESDIKINTGRRSQYAFGYLLKQTFTLVQVQAFVITSELYTHTVQVNDYITLVLSYKSAGK